MGTVNYMSPEQLLGQRVDRRCDIFSFGVVLCEMLTGTCPFVNKNRIDTMHAILHEEPRLLTRAKSELPPDLQRILGKALAKTPKDRYQTVNELADGTQGLQARSRTGQGSCSRRPKPDWS